MDALFSVFTGDNTRSLPRRAKLSKEEGYLEEVSNKDEEVHTLSRLCEILREWKKEPIYSRNAQELLRDCMRDNEPKGWRALSEDIMRHIITSVELTAYFQENPEAACSFMRCMVESKSSEHAASIAMVLSASLHVMNATAIKAFKASLGHGRAIKAIKTFASHCRTLPVGVRLMANESFGRILDSQDLVQPILDDLISTNLFQKDPAAVYDVICILAHSPIASVAPMNPEFTKQLINLCTQTPPPRRGPLLRMLSKAPPEDPLPLEPLIAPSLHNLNSLRDAATLIRVMYPSSQLLHAFAKHL